MKLTDDRKGDLAVILDGNPIADDQIQIRVVPLKDILSTLVLENNNFRDEDFYLDPRKVVYFKLKNSDVSIVVENLVSESALFIGNDLSRYPIYGERNQEIN